MTQGMFSLHHSNTPGSEVNSSSPPPINWSTKPRVYNRDAGALEVSQNPSVNGSLPPPINWITKPRGYNCEAGALDGSQRPSSTSGDRHQLQLLSHHLSRSARRAVNNQQDGADPLTIESDRVDIPVATSNQVEQQDGHHSLTESPESLELTSTFSRLLALIDPVPLHPTPLAPRTPLQPMPIVTHALLHPTPLVPRSPPGFPPYSSTYQPLLHAKYYVVVKGKCTGVYYGNWDDIRCLVDHVPGARHKSFKTLEQATAFYLDAKRSRKVDFIRNPGDVARFGPDVDAIQ